MPATATPAATYELLPSGAVERIDPDNGDRLLMAKLDENNVLDFVTTHPKQREIVRRVLKDAGRTFTERTAAQIAKGPAPETVTVAQARADWRAGLNPEQVKAMIRLRREQGFPDVVVETTTEKFRNVSKQGDKDPAYVLWLLRYKPAKFAKLYGIIGQAFVIKYDVKKDPESLATKKVARKEFCVMTRRKTHLTEKPSVVGGPGTQLGDEGQDE